MAAAYSETSSAPINDPRNAQAPDTKFFQIGAYVQHMHSGLWLYGAYTDIESDDQFVNGDAGYLNNDSWYIKSGLRRRWHPLGHTVLYAEYQHWNQDALRAYGINNGGAPGGGTCSAFFAECTAETDMWGLGVVQEIDAAAMSLWLTYRNIQADVKDVRGGSTGSVPTEDFQYAKFGALINF